MNVSMGKQVLLVDDDEHLLVTLGDFLAYAGFDVTTARDAEEGLDKLQGPMPDIIILDIGMPGMGGLGFLKSIAGQDGKPRCPVLVFTARAAMKDFFDAFEADGFLAKPCEGSVLLAKIHEILEKRRGAAQGGGAAGFGDVHAILLGEDDVRVSDAVIGILERGGYRVQVARSGPELLEMAVQALPGLIVVKQVFPKMNGDMLAAVLHEMPKTRATPVLIYDSSGLWEGHRTRCLAASPAVKRFISGDDPAEILGAVEHVLRVS